jgi:hypothetical protein
VGRSVAPGERCELGVAGWRIAVGCGVGQIGHQILMSGRQASSLAGAPSSRVHANLSRDDRLGRRDWDA